MPALRPHNRTQDTQALALGTYRHDVAYTGALKSGVRAAALGNYRNDVAYTAALKSAQTHALGNYRQDVAYAAALKSISGSKTDLPFTGVEHGLAPVIFWDFSDASAVTKRFWKGRPAVC